MCGTVPHVAPRARQCLEGPEWRRVVNKRSIYATLGMMDAARKAGQDIAQGRGRMGWFGSESWKP
eukprot:7629440-Pyramimonas_sp.AAC.1